MNKIIFLDIDGVLNPQHYMNCLHKIWKASFSEIKSQDDFGDLFFEHNCDALQMIVDATGADIVISSTWRLAGGIKMKELWMHRKLAGKIIGITPTEVQVVESGKAEFYDAVCRGMEIAHWIDTNNFKGNYVIIDDTEDMLKLQEPFFVKTNSWVGLTYKDAKKAIDILNTKPVS
jgi:HAD domain in Swiss Army Knife RNA repair proteins